MAKIQELDLRQETQESIQKKLSEIEEMLKISGANPQGDLYFDFIDLKEAANKYFSSKKRHIKKNETINYLKENSPKIEYAGMAGTIKVIVKHVYDHLFLTRMYRGHHNRIIDNKGIKMSWRFNEEGRLDLMDAILFPERYIKHIVIVKPQIPKEWYISQAIHFPIEDSRITMINNELENLSINERCERLIYYGHSTAKRIYQEMKKKEIKSPDSLKGSQISLQEIINNEFAMSIIRKASFLWPRISESNKDKITIKY